MQRLNHPNVVKAIPVPSDLTSLRSKLPLMCMEFCSKGDLRQVLNRSENCCGLREPEVRALISDVKSAVHYLHYKKITHRDLKPENIVLQQTEGKIVYKLIDLGYAKELDQSSICTSFVGTLQYLAPELFMSKTYNYSVDYWSLGLVSHEVITGVRPFLPNMAPVSWMTHVREKSSDDICAYQASDGSIVFSKELFAQNHISSCLKYHMEKWLKILLEWDASKRGRIMNKNNEPDIVVFDFIEDILSKKIVNVFCVPTYQHLSYEIDDATALRTLQLWIERDTGLSMQSQELLLPSGQPPDTTQEACQCWAQPPQSTMLFVFRRGVLTVEQVTPHIPPTVSKMMEEPRSLVEYVHQKRAWGHAVFFLQQEMELYHDFLQAYRLKLHHVVCSDGKLTQQARDVSSLLHQVAAQLQLSLDSLHFDKDCARRGSLVGDSTIETWSKMSAALSQKVSKLKEVVEQLRSRCDGISGRVVELQRAPLTRVRDHDVLVSLYEQGQKCYDNLRRRPKESRQQRSDNVEMVKVVYNCLKQRDRLLRDKSFDTCLQQVVDVQAEMEQLWNPLNSSVQVIQKVQAELRQTQLDRQQDIWQQMSRERDQRNGYHTRTPSPSAVTPTVEKNSMDLNLNRHSPSLPASGENMEHQLPAHSLQGDTSVMINDNKTLRYLTQDLINESFKHYCTVLSDDQTLNWDFLEHEHSQD
ncbi:inhibitor of nuclear factor kappa-B kinase subunit alpha isoform X2 [Periplaneta americana]